MKQEFYSYRRIGVCAPRAYYVPFGQEQKIPFKNHIIDRNNGEWFWSLRADGTQNTDDDKAGFWKCPYHNGRMCLEIIERVRNL